MRGLTLETPADPDLRVAPPEPGTGRSRLRAAWPWLRLLIGLGIVVALVWQLGARSFLEGLSRIDAPEVLAALGIGAATTVLCALRWCLVARRLGLRLPLGQAVGDYYRALFLNAVLPAGVLGDVHRAVRHGKQEGDVGRGVRAVLLERTAGQAVIIAAAVGVLLTLPVIAPVRDIILVALGAVALLAIAFLAARGRVRPDSRWGRAFDDVRVGLLARNAWPGVVALSAAALAGHVALFVIAAHAAGVTAPVTQIVPLVVLSLLAMGLPVNIGGFGPREGVTALLFGAAGLGSAQGLTAAMIYGVLGLVASLPGILMLARRTAPQKEGVTS
ncbi:MAG TPA: lysylphosphatidylglycerol synthase transmembrane domain-containing protein [Actinophytocola sp.]|uniref:lysylphosphatidylglycerol synthase transmembrane domain-containing protein n=1 Tax=Actinophytocola sp. TaxID=1872138 RepID=UPI002DBC55D1|nr:lysylphosphatidylglycerol synthase transmembrane domain-containing protein [Actinophytocola sp.]HEU5475542.1 lysylphosphatidylglycerol synthase transmembrane domain-containing protein [Actinophytocola sp.]